MSGLRKTFDSNIKTRLRRATIDTSTDQQLNPTRSGAGIKNWFSDYYSFQDQAASILQLTVPSSGQPIESQEVHGARRLLGPCPHLPPLPLQPPHPLLPPLGPHCSISPLLRSVIKLCKLG